MSDDLVAFLRARIDEDEAAAKVAASRPLGPAWDDGTRHTSVAAHINRHDPARVLREVEAKRKIIACIVPQLEQWRGFLDSEYSDVPDFDDGDLLKMLALPHSDHPDYQQEWRP